MAVRDVQLIGDKKLIKKLKGLSTATQKKIVRPSVTKAVRVIAKDAKGRAPKDTGLLKKSIGQRVKTYRSGNISGIVGPRSGFKRTVEIDGKAVIKNPTKYSHLVEFGTSRKAARPFLRPALEAKKSEAVRIMTTEINANIKKQIAKGAT